MGNDPAFLFYDGDASRDVSHMNRLERGCYFDLIQAQKKFGPYTIEQAQKILGKDFIKCWPAIEMILTKNESGKYFIAWLSDSIDKRKHHSEKQRTRIQNYWDSKKESDSTVIPRNETEVFHGTHLEYTKPIPLVNEIENSIKGVSVKGGIVQEMNTEFKKRFPKYPQDQEKDFPAILALAEKIGDGMGICKADVIGIKRGEVLKRWGEIVDFVRTDKWFSTRSISDLLKEYQRLIQTFETSTPVKNLSKTEVQTQIEQREKQNANLSKKYGN